MPPFLAAFLVTFVAFVVIDMVWLMAVMRGFYVAQLGELMRPQPGIVAAVLFYALYAAGLTHFAVLPGLRGDGIATAATQGALLGLVAYATYDLTNLATLKGWPLTLSIVDMAWGAVLSGLVATIAVLILRRLGVG